MNDAEYIAAIAEFYKDGPSPEFRAHYERLMHISGAIAAAPAQVQPEEANDDDVICPKCVHQFRAIPVNVQRLMLDAGFVPPFTAAPAQAGEYPELPPLQVRYDGLGRMTTLGYGVSQMRDYADATCAARKTARKQGGAT